MVILGMARNRTDCHSTVNLDGILIYRINCFLSLSCVMNLDAQIYKLARFPLEPVANLRVSNVLSP